MEDRIPQIRWQAWLSFALLLGLGLYLLGRDLHSLYRRSQLSIDQAATSLSLLIPPDLVSATIQTKNSKTEADSQLRQSLKNLQIQLNLPGHALLTIPEGSAYRVLSSSHPDVQKGEFTKVPTGPFNFASAKRILPTEAIVVYSEPTRTMALEIGSFIFNYLLLAAGLALVGLIFLRRPRAAVRPPADQSSASMGWIHESAEPALIVDQSGRIVDANASAGVIFHSHAQDLIDQSLFDETQDRFQILPLEGALALSPYTLKQSESSRGKMKIQINSEIFRYASYACSPLAGSQQCLILFHDLTTELIREQELTHAKSALLEKNEILAQQIITDPLTKTLNRFYLHHFLQTQNLRWLRTEGASLLAIDLDGFKQLNDSRGHLFGDTVLRSFGLFLRSFFRRSDKIIRTGGDEFLVFLPGVQLKEAARIAQNFIEALRKTPLESETKISASVGVAQFAPDESAKDWLERADAALYDAKRAGKNTYCTQTNESLEVLDS